MLQRMPNKNEQNFEVRRPLITKLWEKEYFENYITLHAFAILGYRLVHQHGPADFAFLGNS